MAGGGEKLVGAGKEGMSMPPWEQHSTVIRMPRYDYKALSSLLQRSHSGFLITCTIKREKSATREAIFILEKYLQKSSYNRCSGALGCFDADETINGRNIYGAGNYGEFTNGAKGNITTVNIEENSDKPTGEDSKDASQCTANEDFLADRGFNFSLVKLSGSGLVLLMFQEKEVPDTVDTVLNMMQSGHVSPRWCHRIFPIQATCILDEQGLHAVVVQLVGRFVSDNHNELVHPVKFAVGYNRRGMEQSENNRKNKRAEESNGLSLLDRDRCFAAVAAAVKDVIADSVVDLKAPEVCVLVELLPVSGMPEGTSVAAVSVIPQIMVSTKPRLCVEPLGRRKSFD